MEAPVDWEKLEQGIHGEKARTEKKKLYPHVLEVRDKVFEYFKENERGRLIMACGTGKTMTSLKIAENKPKIKERFFFLFLPLHLIGQTLKEWSSQADEPINPICICSDPEITRNRKQDDQDLTSTIDLAWPASTDSNYILKAISTLQKMANNGMTVVFSTYQSIEVIAKHKKYYSKTVSLNLI
jgi:predicted helicase